MRAPQRVGSTKTINCVLQLVDAVGLEAEDKVPAHRVSGKRSENARRLPTVRLMSYRSMIARDARSAKHTNGRVRGRNYAGCRMVQEGKGGIHTVYTGSGSQVYTGPEADLARRGASEEACEAELSDSGSTPASRRWSTHDFSR